MRVLFASAEVFPLAKTGGLADVSAALPFALSHLGADVRIVMPGYTMALDSADAKMAAIPLGEIGEAGEVFLIPARLPDSGLPIWLVDCPHLFRREGGIYLDAQGHDWPDNALRFGTFAQAVTRLALRDASTSWQPQVIHANDWHVGLVPALLAAHDGPRPPTVLTIHNLAFQGIFPAEVYPTLGLPPDWFSPDAVEFYGQVSMLKAGIRFADKITTVSPTYAEEIMTPEFGCGLEGFLQARAANLVGILNGIDEEIWSPEDPTSIPYPFSTRDLAGKRLCKAALQSELGLAVSPDTPIIAFLGRLTEQKMADILPGMLPILGELGAQFVVCANGDAAIEERLTAMAASHPDMVAVQIGYEEGLARRILAGSDILAAPSRFEPCGLTQMYAMRYGTIPIVRNVGGLQDTVIPFEPSGPTATTATGFMFTEPSLAGFAEAMARACLHYRKPVAWRAMQLRAMHQDFRWTRSARQFLSLYQDLVPEERAAPQPTVVRGERRAPRRQAANGGEFPIHAKASG